MRKKKRRRLAIISGKRDVRKRTFGRDAFRGRIKCNDVTLSFSVTCTVLSLSYIAWYVYR